MNANTNKERISGIIGTSVFHLFLILFLFFYYIKPSFDTRFSNELEGVPVMFGNVPDAWGDDEPFGRGSGSEVNASVEESPMVEATPETVIPKPSTSPNTTNSNVATQDMEETVAIKKAEEKAAAEKKKQEQFAAEEKRKQEAEAQRVAQAQADAKKNINNQMSGLFGNGSGSGSRGNTTGTGTQGVPTGNASHGKTSGVGGFGTYDLGGRGVGGGGLVRPSYNVNADGKVVVDIIVDPKGNVLEATIGKGTTATNATLRSEALAAAKRTKFNAASTVGNQKGTITYMFNLN